MPKQRQSFMPNSIKYLAYAYTALHGLADVTLAIIAFARSGDYMFLLVSIGSACFFSFFLYDGLRTEEFFFYDDNSPDSSARQVQFWVEPLDYWIDFTVLVFFHLVITLLFVIVIFDVGSDLGLTPAAP